MAVEFYLKLDGFTGESVNVSFRGQIQIASFSFGGTNQSSVGIGTGSGSGKVSLGPLTLVKQPDSASSALFSAMCSGKHIATGLFSIVKAGASQQAYLTLSMTEVFVTGFSTSSSNEIPTETILLTYKEIQYTYLMQNSAGNLEAAGAAGWSLAQNKAV